MFHVIENLLNLTDPPEQNALILAPPPPLPYKYKFFIHLCLVLKLLPLCTQHVRSL